MSDIRKRHGAKGTTYQVRFPSGSTKSGYAYKTFRTLKEARAFREDSRNRPQSYSTHSHVRTMGQAIDYWLDICAKEGTENHEPVTRYTMKTYEHRAGIMKRYDWQKPLIETTPADVRQFKSWLIENCVSRYQAMKVLSSFHTVMQEMAIRDIVTHNPVSGISVRMGARYKTKIDPPSEKEMWELLAAADRLANSKNVRIAKSWQRYRPILYLAADTGARPQEYLAVPAYNFVDMQMKVDRAIERGGHRISATKTEAGQRWIDVSPETFDMVRHYAENHAPANSYNLAFPTSTGHWQSVDHWRNRAFYKACEEAGLVEDVEVDGEIIEKPKYSPYDLRHFYASMLIEKRLNLKRIQSLLGHESITTTLNTYGHLIDRIEAAKEDSAGLLAVISGDERGLT